MFFFLKKKLKKNSTLKLIRGFVFVVFERINVHLITICETEKHGKHVCKFTDIFNIESMCKNSQTSEIIQNNIPLV